MVNFTMAEYDYAKSERQRYIVVDDDRMNNLVSKFVIQRHDNQAEIQLFTDPEIALANIFGINSTINDQQQSIILLDINMPMMNGWDFLEQVENQMQTKFNHFRIYMISSSIDLSDKKRAEDHRLLSGFFSKPLNDDHLKLILSHGQRV